MKESYDGRALKLEALNQALQEAGAELVRHDEVDFALDPECWPPEVLTVECILAFLF